MPATTETSPARRWRLPRPSRAGLRMPTPVEIAVVCELVALAYSVAANIIGVWRDGPIAVGAAAMLPLFLIGGVYLLLSDRIPVAWALPRPVLWTDTNARVRLSWTAGAPGWAPWWANLMAALLLIGPPAVASYHHQRELLTAVHTPWWLAAILPLPVDGLAIRAALTLFRLAHQRASASATDATGPASDVKVILTADEPVAAPVTVEPGTPSEGPSIAPAATAAAPVTGTPTEPAGDPVVARLLAVPGIDMDLVERARTVVNTPVPNRYGKLALPGRPKVAELLDEPSHIARHLLALRVTGPTGAVDTADDQGVSA